MARPSLEMILVCVECEAASEADARGWRAFLTVDEEVATYYPECSAKEFGHAC